MLRSHLPLFILAPLALSLAACESTAGPSYAPDRASDAAFLMATSEYAEMISALRDLYDRALERGYSQSDIVRAASARDDALDAQILGLEAADAARLGRRLEVLRGELERKHPVLAEPDGIEAVSGPGMNSTAATGCRWLAATTNLFRCAKNGTVTTYIACAMFTWANYCDGVEFTDFLEGVGAASDAFGGGGGGAY